MTRSQENGGYEIMKLGPTMSTQKPWVQCERCRQMFPDGQLYTCGPGGRWLYCGRCFDQASKPPSDQPSGDE